MYHLINSHIGLLLNKLDDGSFVPEYEWLIGNVATTPWPKGYEDRYTQFWRLNSARLTPTYRSVYFDELKLELATSSRRSLPQLCLDLYKTPTYKKGGHSLQFSFSTKLCHMLDPHLPIYDNLVADFYLFSPPIPDKKKGPEPCLAKLNSFYEWLIGEYVRVLRLGLMKPSIDAFNARFPLHRFTEEKIIDSLIWAYVAVARNRAILYC